MTWCNAKTPVADVREADVLSSMFAPLQLEAPSGVYTMSVTPTVYEYTHIQAKELTAPRAVTLNVIISNSTKLLLLHKGFIRATHFHHADDAAVPVEHFNHRLGHEDATFHQCT